MKKERSAQKKRFRFFRFIGKFFVYALFIGYLWTGSGAAITLIKISLNNRQDISALHAVIQRAVERDRPNTVAEWVHFRPESETPELIKIIKQESGQLDASTFFELARRQVRLGHIEDALFWIQLGRYRIRYDALRCAAPNAPKLLNKIVDLFVSADINDLLQKHPELVKKSVQQVLDFDTKYPARNSPSFICDMIGKTSRIKYTPVPQKRWGDVRFALRVSTESFLNAPDKK